MSVNGTEGVEHCSGIITGWRAVVLLVVIGFPLAAAADVFKMVE